MKMPTPRELIKSFRIKVLNAHNTYDEELFNGLEQQALASLREWVLDLVEIHTHDSIPTQTSEVENGCVTCIRNKAIVDIANLFGEEK
ncbi:hypothetical protein FJZ33_02725 [Candidatus Poribacteria bacterium]|nr:hypothetical protein [Candidatus Poribacteria bacterium]